MNKPPLLYRWATNATVPLIPHILRTPRQQQAHRARLAATAGIVAWGKRRDHTRPLAWFHAPSVGEGLQAEVVIHEFRQRHPEALLLYTHFSPSAEALAARLPVDWAGYLPYDREHDIAEVLDALKPDLLVFTKLDLWPTLACAAATRGTRVCMVAATVEAGSSRLGRIARALIAPGYSVLASIGTISEADGQRLTQLGAKPATIHVVGDPRIDSALNRAGQRIQAPWLPAGNAAPMIAGSTWGPDESVILDAFAQLRGREPDATVILVPHDPTPLRLDEIEALAASLELPLPVRLSRLSSGAPLPSILVVDQLGMLADLYRFGAFAYVGGGFGSRGIHSVLEPAAAARAVVIGPNDRGSRDAQLLEHAGSLIRLPESGAVQALLHQWQQWQKAPAEAISAGALALTALHREAGATVRSVDLLDAEFPQPPAP